MTHLDEQQLLLHAYGETPETDPGGLTEHLASCDRCRERLEAIERGRVLVDLAFRRRRRAWPRLRWAASALALAASVGALLLARGPRPGAGPTVTWNSTDWSAPSGYVAGGTALVALDSVLTRLEQELAYANR